MEMADKLSSNGICSCAVVCIKRPNLNPFPAADLPPIGFCELQTQSRKTFLHFTRVATAIVACRSMESADGVREIRSDTGLKKRDNVQ